MNISKKTIAVLFASSLFSVFGVMAERIDMKSASDMARNFVSMKRAQFRKAPTSVNQKAVYAPQANGETLYYVFNNSDDAGFTIISADDRLPAVLGYTTSGSFNMEMIPENMKWWLSEYAREIDWFFSHQDDSTGPARKIESDNMSPIAPLMTTTWDQGQPYNDLCPDSPSGRTYTGCVATGMAQVMNFYQWPPNGTGERNNISFETAYDWQHMLDSYSSSYTEQEANAVATLMRHCGAATDMNYSTSGSGTSDASMHRALLQYFRYNPGTRLMFRDYVTLTEWENLVYNELKHNGPVIMCGQANGGGHCFVVDGYQGEGFFHLNWGWSGYQDGYFLLYSLNPASGGAGSFEGGYNSSQSIIIDFTPEGRKDTPQQNYLITSSGLAYSPSDHAIKFTGEQDNLMYNPIGRHQYGVLYVVFEDINDPDAKTYCESYDIDLNSYYGYSSIPFEDPELPDGEYKVYPVWKPEGEAEYIPVHVPVAYPQYLRAKSAGGNITFLASGAYESMSQVVVTSVRGLEDIHAGMRANISMEVANVADQTDYSGVIGIEFTSVDNPDNVVRFGVNTTIAAGRSKTINMSGAHNRAAGTYKVRMLYGTSDNLKYIGDEMTLVIKPAIEIEKDANVQPTFNRFDLSFAETGEEVAPIISLKNNSKKVLKFQFILKIMDCETNEEVASYMTGEQQLLANKDLTGYFALGSLNIPAGHYYATGAIKDIKNGIDYVPIGGMFPLTVTRYGEIGEDLAVTVLSENEGTARLATPRNGHYSQTIEIPECIDGKYTVTELDGASMTFNPHVTDVTLPSTVTRINSGVFYKATSLKSLTINSEIPPVLGKDAFSEQGARNTAIYLPAGAAQVYSRAPGWEAFHIPSWSVSLYQGVTLADGGDACRLYVSSNEEAVITLGDTKTVHARLAYSDGTEEYISGEGTLTLPALGIMDGNCAVAYDLSAVCDIFAEGAVADVYDTHGVLVRRSASAMDVDALPAGIYIVGGRKLVKY